MAQPSYRPTKGYKERLRKLSASELSGMVKALQELKTQYILHKETDTCSLCRRYELASVVSQGYCKLCPWMLFIDMTCTDFQCAGKYKFNHWREVKQGKFPALAKRRIRSIENWIRIILSVYDEKI